jgi:NNP family nitrate/nitrite transporter-like MFS transporter
MKRNNRIISGLIVDKVGAKKIVTICLFVAFIGMSARIFANNYWTLYICMLSPGLAATFINSTNAKIFGQWFPANKVSFAVGLFLAASALGMSLGTGTTAILPNIKVAFILAAVISLVMVFLWIFLMKDKGEDKREDVKETVSICTCLKKVLSSKGVIVAGLSIMCTYGTYMIISTYLPSALIYRGIDAVTAGATSSIVSIAYLVGCIGAPIILDKIGNTRILILILALVAAITSAFAWRAPAGVMLIACLSIVGLAIGGLLPIFMALPIRIKEVGSKYAGTAGGIISTLQLLGAVVIPTYILVPIAGDNYTRLFIYAGISVALVCLLCCLLPKDIDKNKE